MTQILDNELTRLLTVDDVGKMIGVSEKTVLKLDIPRVKFSQRLIRFKPKDIEDFITSHTKENK